MAPQLTHAGLQELLGAYALDAVDPDEAVIIEAHLVECPRCRAELAEHREAVTLLSFSGSAAPEGVWSRIAANLDDTPPPLELSRLVPARRQPPAWRAVAAIASVAAAVIAVIAVLAVQVVQQSQRIEQLAAIADQRGLDQAAAAAAVSPEARRARLQSDDRAHTVDAVVLPDGHGYLVAGRLPRLDRDQTYQLWGVLGAQTISLGLLGDDPAVTSFKAAGPLSALAITAEHAGGAVAPTRAPVVQGFLSTA